MIYYPQTIQTRTLQSCHSGKSTAARKLIDRFGFSHEQVLYLIDTTAGKDAILSHEKAQTVPYEWAPSWHVRDMCENRFITMTYHAFGDPCHDDPAFLWNVRLIICDEMHNLLKFERIQESKNQKLELIDDLDAQKSCTYAFNMLSKLTGNTSPSSPMLIAITATADQVIRAFDKHNTPYHAFDYRGKVHCDKTKQRIYYSDFKSIADQLVDRAIIYVPTINLMQDYADILDNGLYRIACLWSVHNKDYPMSDEQLAIRDEILKTELIPENIDFLLINAAYETSINIRNEDFKTVIIHSGTPDVQIQVCGRLRHDIDTLYIHDKVHEHIVDYFPEEYYDRMLFKADKDELIQYLHMIKEDGRLIKWTTLKKKLQKGGLIVAEGRINNLRYSRILRNSAA